MDLRDPLQTVRNGFQQYIPILVSQSVIDMFEIIQIQIEQSAFAAFCLCFLNILRQIPFTTHTVVQSCQEIRICLLLDLTLIYFFIRNIMQGTKGYFPAIYPVNLCLMQIIPVLSGGMLQFIITLLHKGTFCLLQQSVDRALFQLLFKFVLHQIITKQYMPGFLISDINTASHRV